MFRNHRFLMLGLLAGFAGSSVEANDHNVKVFKNASLIDGTGNGVISNSCVEVELDVITKVASCEDFVVQAGAQVIDLEDKYLLPGFIDTHVHAAWGPLEIDTSSQVPVMSLEYDDKISRQLLSALPGYGITTIRNPAAPTQDGVALRNAVAAGFVYGPEIITAGAVIDQIVSPDLVATARTEEEIASVVAQQVEAGVDFIKLYASLPPNLIEAAIKKADELGVQTVGHLFFTDWRQAAELGIDGIVHAMPSSASLLPAARQGEYLAGITGSQFLYQWFEYVDFESSEMEDAFTAMAYHGVNHDPTLVAVEGLFFGNEPRITNHSLLDLVPQRVRDDWHVPGGLIEGWDDTDFIRAQMVWPKVLELVKRMHDAGIMLTAGTDTANPNVIPGDGYHRELELLVIAGIATRDVIRIATLNGAVAIGRSDTLGSIEPGKQADLVVISKNPLEDITNTREIISVYKKGKLFHSTSKDES